ncbi:MAG: sulfatase [Bacteroidales bacterium]
MTILKNGKIIIPISAGFVLQSISIFAQQNTQRPNIVFIMSDDHASKAISCYEGSINKTPQIDRIARNGVRFTNCFCTNAVSGPSRATILTGQLSHINGMINNEVVFDSANLTIPKVLRTNGYQTAIVGKWHLTSTPSGFDFYKICPGQDEYFNPDFIENGEKIREKGYITDIIADESIEWMSKRDTTKPFFIMIHNKAPHRSWLPKLENIGIYDSLNIPIPDNFFDDYSNRSDAAKSQQMSIYKDMRMNYDLKIPDSISIKEKYFTGEGRLSPEDRKIWDNKYALRNKDFIEHPLQGKELAIWKYRRYINDYLATVKTVDDNVGKILDYLKGNGLEENTIVIYTSDQGFFLGEHGWFDKRFMYDESYKMPLLIQYPAKLKAGKVNDQLLMNLDFAPTFLDWAGIKKPKQMQGISFASYIDNSKRLRDATYYHYYEYPGEHTVKRHYGIRTESFKLIHYYYDIDQWELFDLKKDPKEMLNVFDSPDYKNSRIELTEKLNKMRKEYADTVITIPVSYVEIPNKALNAKYELLYQPSLKYQGKAKFPLTDGKIENKASTKTGLTENWIGFEKNNFEITLPIDSKTNAKEIEIRFLDLPDSWIFEPESIEFYSLNKNNEKSTMDKPKVTKVKRRTGGDVIHYKVAFNQKYISKIIIKAVNHGVCPSGHPGEGNPAWIFTDEVILR